MRAKAPPFARRLRAALEAARAAGFARVRVSTSDGSTFVFSQDDVDALPPNGEVEVNDFDLIIERRKGKTREEKP
jgi:hypothetical protein